MALDEEESDSTTELHSSTIKADNLTPVMSTSALKKISASLKPSESVTPTKNDCLGCKLVAGTTPLLISGYLMMFASEKNRHWLPIAANWTGTQRWRWTLHRCNMGFLAPFAICTVSYSYLLKLGPFRPDADNTKGFWGPLKRDVQDISGMAAEARRKLEVRFNETVNDAAGVIERSRHTFSTKVNSDVSVDKTASINKKSEKIDK